MRKRYWLGIVLSGLLVYLMLRSVDPMEVGRALSGANYVLLLPALLFYFAGVLIRTVRWAVLLRPVASIPLSRLFVVIVVGFMANDLLPFRAGEGVRAFMLWRKERVEPGATVATIVVERIFDGLVLTGFLVLVGLLIPLESWLTQIAWGAGAVFALGVATVFALAIVPRPLMAIAKALLMPFPPRLRLLGQRLLGTFVEGLSILRSGRDVAAVALLSVLAWVLEATMYYVLMYSFPFAPTQMGALLGTAVANLGTMVPSSPGYVGTFDLPLSAVLVGTFQIDPALAAGYTFLVHAALVLPVSLLGLFFVWREGLSLGGISAASERVSRDSKTLSGTAPVSHRQVSP